MRHMHTAVQVLRPRAHIGRDADAAGARRARVGARAARRAAARAAAGGVRAARDTRMHFPYTRMHFPYGHPIRHVQTAMRPVTACMCLWLSRKGRHSTYASAYASRDHRYDLSASLLSAGIPSPRGDVLMQARVLGVV